MHLSRTGVSAESPVRLSLDHYPIEPGKGTLRGEGPRPCTSPGLGSLLGPLSYFAWFTNHENRGRGR